MCSHFKVEVKITRSQIEGSSDWYFIKRYLILAITSRMSLRIRCIVLPTFRRGWLRGHLHRLSSAPSSFSGIADISHRYFALDWPSRCICKLHLKLINTLQFWSISTMIDILRSFTKETIANLHHIYLLLTCCSLIRWETFSCWPNFHFFWIMRKPFVVRLD